MSVVQKDRIFETASENYFTTRAPWWRALALAVLLASSLAIAAELVRRSPLDALAIDVNNHTLVTAVLTPYSLSFIPYLLACGLVLLTRPARGGWRWLELGLILAGALILRALLVPLPPNLSRDSWRYLWDARVFLHGYSPYVHAPGESVLMPLRDALFENSRYRNVPTIYPPGAQYIYILSYLLASGNLSLLKGIFVAFDLLSCLVLVKLLLRKGLDPARVILYAWSPLPIVEFALQGHVDALTVTFALLAVLSASDTSWRGRGLTGFLVGLATLSKLYPILLLVPLVRLRAWRRDWLLILSCLLTIVMGYLPFYLQGHGQIFGFFSTYSSEQGANAGFIQLFVAWLGDRYHLPLATLVMQEHLVDLLLLVGGSLAVLLLRQRERISLEAGVLLLFGLVLAISSHVFPWYTTALLPWLALLWPAPGMGRTGLLLLARWLTLGALLLFTCISVSSYVVNWDTYYLIAYKPLAIVLLLSIVTALIATLPGIRQKGTACAKE